MKVRVIHLCVDSSRRDQGIARTLVDYLRRETASYPGLGLWCRRDFPASKMWGKLGFVPKNDKVGRSHDGKRLTFWWLDHGHPSLFNYAENQGAQRVKAAIDSTVFLDLHAETGRPERDESKALLADWLQDHIELYMTRETFHEIDRNPQAHERERLYALAGSFSVLPAPSEVVGQLGAEIRQMLAKEPAADDGALQHVIQAVAGEAKFLVTRNDTLLRIADRVYPGFDLRIVRPCDLILELDELLKEVDYQPARLGGSHVSTSLTQGGQEALLCAAFRVQPAETEDQFLLCLRGLLAEPRINETRQVRDVNGGLLALLAYKRQAPDQLEIPLFRVARSPLSPTIARYLLFWSVGIAVGEERVVTRVTDPHIEDAIVRAMQDVGFVPVHGAWTKVSLAVAGSTLDVAGAIAAAAKRFKQEGGYLGQLGTMLSDAHSTGDTRVQEWIEDALWPAKIVDTPLPCFIVPIRPQWAKDLFDEEMAAQMLLGANPELVLNLENVYYRAKQPAVLVAPGRILWYVSQDQRYYGSKQLRACSQLDQVVTGQPLGLYRRFRRLGVYEWSDVLGTAENDENREIMAVRFSKTELFRKPIAWDMLQDILRRHTGHGSTIQAPLQISNAAFEELYCMGTTCVAAGGSASGG